MPREAKFWFKLVWIMVFPALVIFTSETKAAEPVHLSRGQLIYVPVYSHIYSGDRELPFLLTAILSIRNTDPQHSITVIAADYYDSEGKLIRKYLEKPINLNALASARYIVRESDKSGGSGANFLVRWRADTDVNHPIVEAVMIGTKSKQGISFVSPGTVIRESGD